MSLFCFGGFNIFSSRCLIAFEEDLTCVLQLNPCFARFAWSAYSPHWLHQNSEQHCCLLRYHFHPHQFHQTSQNSNYWFHQWINRRIFRKVKSNLEILESCGLCSGVRAPQLRQNVLCLVCAKIIIILLSQLMSVICL